MKSVKFRTEELLDLFFQNEIKNYERFDFLYNKKRYSFLLNKIIEQIGEKSEKKIKILDVGGGLLYLSSILSLVGIQITAIDTEKGFSTSNTTGSKTEINLQTRRKKFKINQIFIDVQEEKLPFKNNYFDYVIFTEVLEHFWLSPVFSLQEIYRVLKKDGIMFLTTPSTAYLGNRIKLAFLGKTIQTDISRYINENYFPSFHHKEYTKDELFRLLKHIGFDFLSFGYIDFYQKIYNPVFLGKVLRENILLKLLSIFTFFIPSLGQSIYVEAKK